MGLERWAEKFYRGLNEVPHVTISNGITPISISEDAYAGKPNPHAWMSSKLALNLCGEYSQSIRAVRSWKCFHPHIMPMPKDIARRFKLSIGNLSRKLR